MQLAPACARWLRALMVRALSWALLGGAAGGSGGSVLKPPAARREGDARERRDGFPTCAAVQRLSSRTAATTVEQYLFIQVGCSNGEEGRLDQPPPLLRLPTVVCLNWCVNAHSY